MIEATVQVPFLDIQAASRELGDQLAQALIETLDSGWYLLGSRLTEFERAFADYCGTAFSCGVGNGLDALTLSLRAMNIGPGDEVLVPSNTYIASWMAISNVGASIVPIEPDPTTFLPSIESYSASISSRTAALMPVHLYGRPADLERLSIIKERTGVRILEDCAQAHGATWLGRSVGTVDVGAWSFYPGKNLGALGDGGAVTTDDSSVDEAIRTLRNYGSKVKYHNDCLGMNSRLDEIQAAVLSVKLEVLSDWNSRRAIVAERYIEGLGDLDWLQLPTKHEQGIHAWHLFVVQTSDRSDFQRHLDEHRIGSLIHYPIPPHLQPAYSHLGYRSGSFPVAERLATTSLSLPIGPHLSESQQGRVIEAVRSFEPTSR